MAVVQPRGFFGGDEKLRSVGVFTSIGHRQPTSAVVLELEVFVGEFFTIDTAATSAVTSGEISSLDHEVFDDSVEFAAFITFACRFFSKLNEVLGSFGYSSTEQSNLHTLRFVFAHFDVEPNLMNRTVKIYVHVITRTVSLYLRRQ